MENATHTKHSRPRTRLRTVIFLAIHKRKRPQRYPGSKTRPYAYEDCGRGRAEKSSGPIFLELRLPIRDSLLGLQLRGVRGGRHKLAKHRLANILVHRLVTRIVNRRYAEANVFQVLVVFVFGCFLRVLLVGNFGAFKLQSKAESIPTTNAACPMGT